MKRVLDFAAINQAALAAFPAVLNRLLPRGKAVGREIVALTPRRADRNLGSFKVNRYNGRMVRLRHRKQGRRSDFACRLSRGCFAGRGGAGARANARHGNRRAPSWMTPPTPSRLSHPPSLRKRRGKASDPRPIAARLQNARRSMRNRARWRRRGSMAASPMASGATRRPMTKPPSTPRAGTRRTEKRRSARSHGARRSAGNSRLGRIIDRCSSCPISS
jgi:hypothetical protein